MTFVDDGAFIARGIGSYRNRATVSTGRWVAESPIRWSGRSASSCRRSSDSARCAPRRVPMTADFVDDDCPTVPAATARSAVSSRYNDSGVVTRMCGGRLRMAARSVCVVSPVRTAAVMRAASPCGSAS